MSFPDSVTRRITLLRILSDGEFHSGEELGKILSVSRTAIWKMIRVLETSGLDIYSVRGKGYRLPHSIELLDRQQILGYLSKTNNNTIQNLTVLTSTDSTNQYLLTRIGQPDFHAHVVLAEYQSAGRGRRGNTWLSSFAAGINLSIAWHFDPAPDPLTIISLAAGISVIHALEHFGIKDAGLKWPNDIVHEKRKLGGILLEMQGQAAGPCDIVLGIGINYCLPDNIKNRIEQPVTDIKEIVSGQAKRNAISATLINEIINRLNDFNEQQIAGVIEEWRRYDCMQGQMATILLPDKNINGKIMGIDDKGALMMSVDNQIKKFSFGEISLRIHH